MAASVLCLTVVFGWVAFGPGEREFVLEVGVGGGDARGSTYGRGSPVVGRIVFGIATILMGLLDAGPGVLVAASYRRGPGDGPGSDEPVADVPAEAAGRRAS